MLKKSLATVLAYLLIGLVRLLVGASVRYSSTLPYTKQNIYFANHTSHIDTLVLWSALQPDQRKQTRPVAALDYWGKTAWRRYIALNIFNSVLIDRKNATGNSLQPLFQALIDGNSIIIFPEGTRRSEPLPGPFKSGLYHLAQAFPDIPLIPIYLENLSRSMPKGTWIPVPIICTVRFGQALVRVNEENKKDFLERAHQAMVNLI